MSQPPYHSYPPQGGGGAPPTQQQQPHRYPPQQQQQQQGGYVPQVSAGSDTGSLSSSSGPSLGGGGSVVMAAATTPVSPSTTERPKKFAMEDHVLVAQGPDEETEDGVIRNRDAIRKIRDTWIYKQVRLRQDEFTHYRTASVFVGTWNVNAKGKEEPLDPWICADWNSSGMPDIVAVGFQEMVDLNAVNVAIDNKTQQKSQFWCERLGQTLNRYSGGDPARGYTLLMQKSMVGLLVCVFVKTVHQGRVNYVSAASVGVGVMGMMGNKGGVSLRLQFYDSTLCFVCSHLAAHRENVTGRNADFANVYNKTFFQVGEEAIREVIRSGSLSHWAIGSSAVGIPDHDVVFWLGDLNYRIDDSLPTETVLHMSEKNAYDQLLPLDQLNIERKAGRCFANFEEGPIRFPPTYKYQPGTDVYEQRPDKKLRAPAWCDRILWMAQEAKHVQQLTYGRSEQPNVSDHKAVYSTMRVTIKDVIQQKREAIYEELMHKLDKYENKSLPAVGLDQVSLDFGPVKYDEKKTLRINITNTGGVVAHFRLVPKLDESDICKTWMKVSPTYGMIIPGEESVAVDFTLTIDNITAQNLNSGREVLEDILILRLEGGRDYYITVKASYARSCFGMSAEELVMYSGPIRNVPLDPVLKTEKLGVKVSAALSVPKELWRLIDAIHHKGIQTPGLFVESGLREEVCRIRECLDTETAFGQFRIHSYTEALVAFLSSMSTPIIPTRMFPAVELDAQNVQSVARRFLEDLTPIHYNSFVYIISFFRQVLTMRNHNGLSAAKAARICVRCTAPGHGLDNSATSLQKRNGIQQLMMHFLETSSI